MLKYSFSTKEWPAWVMLGAGLVVTSLATLQVKQGIEQDAVRQFAFACDQVTLKIQDRLGAYALILRGAVALLAASDAVDRQEWRTYVETLRAEGSVPGVQGIGFVQVIPADELATHIAHIRSEGFPDYTVRPPGERAIYTSIIYLEPFRDRNLRAFGFDMFSEPVRRIAMEHARDTGEAALSGKVELVQETGTEVQAGTLMYVPVYRNGLPIETVGQRRAALAGWTYSPYRMNDLMTGILRNWESDEAKAVDLHIYDGLEATPVKLLFDSKTANRLGLRSLFYQQRTINFNGHQWRLAFDRTVTPSGINYTDAWATLIGGLALSGTLFGLMLSRINTRTNAAHIADKLTEEIRRRSEALKESEYRWKFAIEGSGDGLWDWDLAGSTVFFSRRWKEMLGFAEDEIGTGLDEWEKRIHPDDKAEALATLQDCLDGKAPIYVSEHRVRCKDGGYKWILDRGMVVSRSEDGKPLRMIGTQTDISERKRAEEATRAASQYSRSLIEASLDPLVTISPKGKITDVNQATEAVTGRSRSELIGTDFSDYFTEQDKAREGYQQVFAKGFVTDYPLILRHRDGRLTEVLYNASVYRNEAGEVLGVFAAARDVTERNRADQEVAQLNLRNRLILDSAGEGIYGLDLDGRCTFVNPAALQLLGFQVEELMGQRSHPLFHHTRPDGRPYPEEECLVYAAYKQGVVHHGIDLYWRKEGSSFPVEFISTPILEAGKITGAVVAFRDITERKRAEENLKQSEEKYRTLIQKIQAAIVVHGADTQILVSNSMANELLGLTEDQMLGKAAIDPDWHFSREDGTVMPLEEYPVNQVLAKRQSLRNYVAGVHRPNIENDVWLLVNADPVFGEDDELTQIVVTFIDITDRKKAELEREQYFKFFSISTDPMGIADPTGAFKKINPAFVKMLGYSEAEILARPFIEFVHPDDRQPTLDEMTRQLQLGFSLDFENRYLCKDGSYRWLSWKANVNYDEGLTYTTAHDITERKQAEDKITELNRNLEQRVVERTAQLEAANKELEAFAYSVSHDLRTPLRAIDGFSRILLDDFADKLDNEGKRLLNVVRDNTSRMGQLIDDILKFSRVGRLEIANAEIDMEELTRAVCDELRPTTTGHEVQVEIEHLPPLTGDRSMMRQVLVNLLSNAFKFSRSKEVARIKVGSSVAENETTYFVQDNGVGFDMQYVDKLFGVFQRLHEVSEFEGTGIGLAIVKRVISRHGGRVWAQGKVNEGATFYFALPTKEAAHE